MRIVSGALDNGIIFYSRHLKYLDIVKRGYLSHLFKNIFELFINAYGVLFVNLSNI